MEPNITIVHLIGQLLKKYTEQNQTETEFGIDDLITAKDSLHKYPIPLETPSEELADIAGFSDALVAHVVEALRTSNSRPPEHSSTGSPEPESRHSQALEKDWAQLHQTLDPMRRQSSVGVTLVVDSRERGKSNTLCEHLTRGKSAKGRKEPPQKASPIESSFDELLRACTSVRPPKKQAQRPPKPRKPHDPDDYAVEERLLPVGDMIWVANSVDSPNSFLLPLIVERKTIPDLASSLVDGRFHAQAERIASAGLPWALYVLEGSLDDAEQCSVPPQALRTALHTLVQRYRFYVYNTASLRETIFLLRHVTRCLKGFASAFDVCRLVPGFARRSYEEWVASIREKDLQRSRSNCFRNMLSMVDGVGPEAVERVSSVFEAPVHIFEYFQRVIEAQDEIHAEFCLTEYRGGAPGTKPMKLCSGAASSAIYKAFYADGG